MAHDVWLLRNTLITCLFLICLTGTSLATNGNLSTDQIALSSDFRDRRLTSGAQNILIKDNSFKNEYQSKQRIDFVHDGSAQLQSANTRLKDSIGRLETKRNVKERIKETGLKKTRMRILDKYFVHPEIMKDKPGDRNGSNKNEEASLSALLLEGPKPGAKGRDFEKRTFGKKTSNIDNHGAASVEGTKIANAASLLENSSRSHDSRLTKLLKYPRYYIPSQGEHELQRAKFKLHSRYRFLNSLIRPQLAGISDDINNLDAHRNQAKSISLKTLKNSFKSESAGQHSKGSASTGEYPLKDVKQKTSIVKERNERIEYNTKMENKPRFNANDIFLLGTPDKTSYFENVFLANPELSHSKPGSAIRPTIRWEKSGATTALKEGEILNAGLEKFGDGSDTTESGLEGFVHPEDESDSNESEFGSDIKFKAALNLAIQSDMRLNKATSGVPLLSFKDKAMSHIEGESNDMYNKQKSKEGYGAGYSNRLEAQKTNSSPHFIPTKMRDFPKVPTLSSYKRTTIPHWKFRSQNVYQSSSSGSGEGSGSGDNYLSSHKSHSKHKHAQKIHKVSLSTKNKTHAGIFGAKDKETVKKCERMGKADYREKCPSGWLPFEEFCYLFVHKSNGKWEEFPIKCNDENGLLAMPKTDKELRFLQHKISSSKRKKKNFYIGLKKKNENWTWIDDVPYTRDVHVKDELGDKTCGALSKDGVHMVTCSEPKAGYICEIRTGVEVFRILAFGDSLTNGFHSDDKSHTPYAQTLEYLLNKDIHRCYTLTTIAKDGTEAGEMSSRLQNHLRDAKFKYSWVIILAGTNDIAHNSQTRYRKAWDTAVERIINLHIASHRYGAKTVAVTIPEMDCEESKRPACLHTHLERKYINEKLRYYARSNEFTILCDLAVKFPRYSLSSDERKLMWEVGLHMKPPGYERMAEIIYKDLLANV